MRVTGDNDLTFGSLVLRTLARYPDRTAFIWDAGELSYRATAELIGRMQAVLLEHGVRRGDRVALLSANRVETWCAGIAAQLCGAATTALHPKGALPDHESQLDDSNARALVVDTHAFAEAGSKLAARDGLRVFTLEPAEYGTNLLEAAAQAGTATARDLARPEDIGTLNYTGGTTGRSKGAFRRHPALVATTVDILAEFELPRTPQYLAVAPISHVSGTKVLPTLIRGGSVHLLSGFDPGEVLATIEERRINLTLAVPTMVYALLDELQHRSADLSSLELLLYGASPMSPTRLAEGMERIGPVFAQLYGQTECYPISYLPKADHDPTQPELLAACGFPITSTRVALLDDAGNPVPAGETGEICVRGPSMMDGYWNQPEQTAEAMKFGWLHTGDVARADAAGRLYIVDRKKDMIVTGGFNVFTRAVEDALTTHPAVAMAAVIGVPDPRWGEAVTAIVVRQPGATVDAETLIRQVKELKGSAHAPKKIEFTDALPTTSLGKIDKKALRARYWAGQSRSVG